MANKAERLPGNNNQAQIRPLIYVMCILGALGSLPTLFLWTTELAYMVGQWYLNFILVVTLLTWVGLVGIWKLKRWGTIIYTLITVVTHVILSKYNVMWSYTALYIPFIVTLTSWVYFKDFK